jgi:hypothetical protein
MRNCQFDQSRQIFTLCRLSKRPLFQQQVQAVRQLCFGHFFEGFDL